MKYNVGENYIMKNNYNHLIKGEQVKIIKREKRGRYTYLDVINLNGDVYTKIPFKQLKKKK